ncbi:MAG TPA: hypothetical protein PLZ57_14885 [Pseudobdellovibrionaceae bacterium]|nr:hypothetical protein [Pseudobdellovibrionaceae bacterium]
MSSSNGFKALARRVFTTTTLLAGLGTSLSPAQAHTLCEGFLPENDMRIPVGFKGSFRGLSGSGVTEAEFNDVLNRIEKIYAPIVRKEGGNLQVKRLWSDATVNASAQQIGSNWVLNMYGGLARHPATNIEGFALVACHEMGHHIGGAPKIAGWFGMNGWATNEGGSDYFATLKCLRLMFATDDNEAILTQRPPDAYAAQLCDKQFARPEDRLICKRISLGGTSVAGLFQALRKETTPPRFDTPDTSRVRKTNDNHPATQCRMDTYLAGALCPVDVSVGLSNSDYRQGSCVEGADSVGFRPRCWFAP